MIKLLDMQPKDIHLLLDFSLADLELLVTILEKCTFNYDSSNEAEKKMAEDLTERIFPNLKTILEAANGPDS